MNSIRDIKHDLKIFKETLVLDSKRFTQYPLEAVFAVVNNLFDMAILTVFWVVVENSSSVELPIDNLLAYYLIASGVRWTLWTSTSAGSNIASKVKWGHISSNLLRPVKLFPVMLASYQGSQVVSYLVGLVYFIIGLIILVDSIIVIQFVISVVTALLIGLAYNRLLAIIAFYLTEYKGFKNAIGHVVTLLNGWLIPIAIMPQLMQSILFHTPFPYLLYVPVRSTQGEVFEAKFMIIGLLYGLVLFYLAKLFWQRALKKYEAVGL